MPTNLTSLEFPGVVDVIVDLTAEEIASPDALILGDIDATFRLNEPPYTRYYSDGTQLINVTTPTDVSNSFVTATGSTTPRTLAHWEADVSNVLAFGADPTGVADSTNAFKAALLASAVVYVPQGDYRITDQLVIGPGQTFYGDGRTVTNLVINIDFNPSATGVLSLVGREFDAPIVVGIRITFTQTTTQTSRAAFLSLAAGGNLTTGIKYPPAIILTTANRFRIFNVSVYAAWDGIINAVGNTIGGFIIDNVEMGALNCGLGIDSCFDFAHIKSYHFWPFGLNIGAVYAGVYQDGNTFAARFGDNGAVNGVECMDFCAFHGRTTITGSSWLNFTSPKFDGNNSTVEISAAQWVQMSDPYFTGAPVGSNPNTAQLNVTGGRVFISNMYAQAGSSQAVNLTGGTLQITGGQQSQVTPSQSTITQSGGFLVVQGVTFTANTGAGAWTQPVVHVTGGIIRFKNNIMGSGTIGDVGFLVIDNDLVTNDVAGNTLNGWGWTPPGPLGAYGFNGTVAGSIMQMKSGATFGSGTGTAVNVNLQSAAGFQRAIPVYTGNTLRWAAVFNGAESGSNTGCDFTLVRYDDAGSFLGNPIQVARATGRTVVTNLDAVLFGLNIGTPLGRQTVTGSRASGAALVSLLNALAAFGLITDSTTA